MKYILPIISLALCSCIHAETTPAPVSSPTAIDIQKPAAGESYDPEHVYYRQWDETT